MVSLSLECMKIAVYWSVLIVALLCCTSCKQDVIAYTTTGIYLENYDNCGDFIRPSSDSIGDSCYVIRVNYESDQTEFNGVNDNNTYQPQNLPTSIFIYALQQFDSLHPAGSSLNEYFIAGPGSESTAEDIITGFPETQDFYPTHDPDDLWLMQSPATTGTYSFVIRMGFNDGVVASDTTTVILN
jgi:hypothetical protein